MPKMFLKDSFKSKFLLNIMNFKPTYLYEGVSKNSQPNPICKMWLNDKTLEFILNKPRIFQHPYVEWEA